MVPSPRSSTSHVVVLELLLLVLEGRARGALLEQGVERLLDVVGVQLLVEVEAVLVVVLLGGGRRRSTGGGDASTASSRSSIVDEFVVELEVVVLVEVLVEVFQFLDLFHSASSSKSSSLIVTCAVSSCCSWVLGVVRVHTRRRSGGRGRGV